MLKLPWDFGNFFFNANLLKLSEDFLFLLANLTSKIISNAIYNSLLI